MKTALVLFALIARPVFSGLPEETFFIENISLLGRTLIHSCSYFSNAETEIEIKFKSGPVEYGTRVFVEFGWAGSDQSTGKRFSWNQKSELELESAPFTTWTGKLTQTIAERTSPLRIVDLNFVFRIEEPGKAPRYVGSPKNGDVFVARLPKVEDSTCVSPGSELPTFSELIVQVVRD
ncbi:MAG: hypothetical protein ACKN9V_03635 [Pseudomonadota bacterium]